MIAAQPITFLNTGVPVLVLAALATALPRLMVGAANTSHAALFYSIALTSLAVLVTGAVVFAIAYGASGASVTAAFAAAPSDVALFFLRLSLLAAVLWWPVLALVWYAMAQGVEKRRGEAAARRGP